ncbi:hypothetical protein J4209_02630 [Candidatus Woesearchaeota archaeon]|nr:hypothetical protein [Candidatus Woesearchaeota archaeon]
MGGWKIKKEISSIIVILLLIFNTTFVSAYPVTIRLTANVGDFYTDVYRCSSPNCNGITFYSSNYGNPNLYTVAGSGTQYFAEYDYLNCYLSQKYTMNFTGSTGPGPWDYDVNFVKKNSCNSTINSVVISDNNVVVGEVVAVTANIRSAFDDPSAPPNKVPSALNSYFSSDIIIELRINGAAVDTRNVDIFMGANQDVQLTWIPASTGTYSVEIVTNVNDCSCSNSLTSTNPAGNINVNPISSSWRYNSTWLDPYDYVSQSQYGLCNEGNGGYCGAHQPGWTSCDDYDQDVYRPGMFWCNPNDCGADIYREFMLRLPAVTGDNDCLISMRGGYDDTTTEQLKFTHSYNGNTAISTIIVPDAGSGEIEFTFPGTFTFQTGTNYMHFTNPQFCVQSGSGSVHVREFNVLCGANTAPTLAGIPNQQTDEDTTPTWQIDLWSYASDNEETDDQLSFSVSSQSNPGLISCSISSNRYLSCGAPAPNQNGYSDVTVQVSDGLLTDTTNFRVTVNQVDELCSDGIDNDGDSLADDLDPGCYDSGAYNPNDSDETDTLSPSDNGCADAADNDEMTECQDSIDNDLDTFTDLLDPGCADVQDSSELNPAVQCDDNIDNDLDTYTDYPNDPGCTSPTDNNELDIAPACSDGSDNDLDGFIDWPSDPGCIDATDTTETNPAIECDDGIDNADADNLIDMADPGCTNPSDTSETNGQMT